MAEKYFNRKEAEELLPRLEVWLGAARQQKQTLDALQADIAKAASQIMMLGGSLPPFAELGRMKSERDKTSQKLQETIDQIQQTGCVVKDLEVGLVDFPSLLRGEEVYLCWKLGEERIAYWHGIDEGFSGRKPLDESGHGEPPPRRPRVQ